jgi:aldehyde dehydrogenase (NAD+)
VGCITAGTPADVDQAVAAARRAQVEWAALAPEDRAAVLNRMADGIEHRQDEFADVITRQTGMLRRLAVAVQVGLPIRTFPRRRMHSRAQAERGGAP